MNSSKFKILVAHADDFTRQMLAGVLTKAGFRIINSKDAGDALEKFTNHKADLMITDIKMPGMNGLRLAKKLRSSPEFAHIPVIFISASLNDIYSRSRRRDVEVNDYITFPLDEDELVHKVNVLLNNKKLYDELLSSQALSHESEQKYRALFENANDSIYIICPRTQRILDCNAQASIMTGYTRKQLKRMSISDLHPDQEQDVVSKIFSKVVKMGSLSGISGIHHLNKDGDTIPIEINATTLEVGGEKFCLGIIRDISDRKKNIGDTIIKEEQWEMTFDAIPDMIAIIDNNHKIVRANKAMLKKLGVNRSSLAGQYCYKMMHGSDRPPSFCPHSKTIVDGKEHIREIYEENLKGYYIVSSSPIYDNDGKPLGVVEVARDITTRKKLEMRIKESAITDDLTGLFNRRGFITIAEKQLKLAKRTKRQLSLLYIDLNRMKLINDRFGHRAGDQALRDTASLLRKSFRDSDIIARIGGDEFAVMLIEPMQHHVENTIIKHLNDHIESHNQKAKRIYSISLSIGISHFNPEKPQSLNDLMRAADESMYMAKSRDSDILQERRLHKRYSPSDELLAEIDGTDAAIVINLGMGGLCLRTSRRLKKNSLHDIRIPIHRNMVITGECQIVRSSFITEKDLSNVRAREYNIGMKFTNMSNKSLDSLEKLIRTQENTGI